MANPVKGETQLGEFTLAFNFGAFCELEELYRRETGQRVRVQELMQMLGEGLGFSDLRRWVWAALQTHHKGVSGETADELIEEVGGYEPAMLAIGAAVQAYSDQVKVKAKGPRKAAA